MVPIRRLDLYSGNHTNLVKLYTCAYDTVKKTYKSNMSIQRARIYACKVIQDGGVAAKIDGMVRVILPECGIFPMGNLHGCDVWLTARYELLWFYSWVGGGLKPCCFSMVRTLSISQAYCMWMQTLFSQYSQMGSMPFL